MDISFHYIRDYILFVFLFIRLAISDGNIQEYCQIDTFNPTCPDNEVVIITHGVFGRMKKGRCVKIDDNLGCSKDVKGFLMGECSGRKSCSVPNLDLVIHAELTCLREMNAYLEAGYLCQTVFRPPIRQCSSPLTIESSSRSQFISSLISQETSCGLHQTPYVIDAKQGQTLEITLHDFNVKSEPPEGSCSIKYGYVLDTTNDNVVNLCGGRYRTKKVLESAGKGVQVLLDRGAVSSSYFMIEFKAVGCPDISAPGHAWIQRGNKTVTIGCQTSDTKWTMKCVGNIWLGIMKDCPAPMVTTFPTRNNEQQNQRNEDNRQKGIPDVSDNHLWAIGISCMTVIVCVTTVVLGIHCVKRYELSIQKKNSFSMNNLGHTTIYKPVNNGTLPSTNAGLPLYTLNRDNNLPELPQRMPSMTDNTIHNNTPDYFNLVNIEGGHNHEKIYQSIPRDGPLLA